MKELQGTPPQSHTEKSLFNEKKPTKKRGERWDWNIFASQFCPLFSKRKGLNHLLSVLNEDYKEYEARLLSRVPRGRMRGSRSDLHQQNSNQLSNFQEGT